MYSLVVIFHSISDGNCVTGEFETVEEAKAEAIKMMQCGVWVNGMVLHDPRSIWRIEIIDEDAEKRRCQEMLENLKRRDKCQENLEITI